MNERSTMSSVVVDSNPYRFVNKAFFISHMVCPVTHKIYVRILQIRRSTILKKIIPEILSQKIYKNHFIHHLAVFAKI